MKALSRTRVLVVVYVLLFVVAIVMAVFEVLSLLPLIIMIGAAGGLLHLAYIVFFARLPDYIGLTKDDEQPKRRS